MTSIEAKLDQLLRGQMAIERRLDLLSEQLAAMAKVGRASMTKAAFARAVGVHPNTVHRWIKQGRLLTERGRIHPREVKHFVIP